MPLSQRDAHLAALGELLNEAKRGRGRAVLVSAVTGGGKTGLLHEFWSRLAPDGDVLLLSASCVETEADLPYGVLSQLFESPPLDTAEAAQALAALDDAVGGKTALAARKVTRMLLQLAERRPVVICVDDAHNADPESVDHLLRLIRGMHAARILAVLTARTRPFKGHSLLHTGLLRQPHVRLMQLEALSVAGVREMIGQDNGNAALAAEIFALTGGNPMLAHTLLTDTRAAGENRPVAGAAFSQAVLACVHSAGGQAVELARAVALLGELATPSLVSALLDTPLDAVTRGLAELEAIGLVRGCGLRHPASAQAVLGDMPTAERTSGHTDVARLAFEVAGPEHAATHLLRAGTVAEPWMVDALIDTAEQVVDNDPEQAKAFLDLARRYCAEDKRRQAAIAAALTRIELIVRPSAVPALVPRLFAAVSEGHVADRVALDLPEILFFYRGAEENAYLFERLVSQADVGDPATLTRLRVARALLTTVFPGVADRIPVLPPESSSADESFTANTRLTVFTKLRSVLVDGPVPAEDVRGLEKVLSATPLTNATATVLTSTLVVLIRSGELRLAEKWGDHLIGEASESGTPTWHGRIADKRARTALFLGDLNGAERFARLGLRRIPEAAWGVSIGGVYATLLRALTEMGRFTEATELLARPLHSLVFESIYGLEFLHARAHYCLATGQTERALCEFEACGRLITEWKLDPSFTSWRCGAVHALLALGKRGAARALAEEQLTLLGPRHRASVRGAALRSLAATEPPDRRTRTLSTAITLLESGGDRLELAKAYRDLAIARRSLGPGADAEAASRSALHAATECQAGPLAEEVAVALHDGLTTATGLTANKPSYLSAAERRVFLLAASGQTNRQIATELYITVSTVEQHLTRIYRKLRVRRRKDLQDRFAARPQSTKDDVAGSGRRRTTVDGQDRAGDPA